MPDNSDNLKKLLGVSDDRDYQRNFQTVLEDARSRHIATKPTSYFADTEAELRKLPPEEIAKRAEMVLRQKSGDTTLGADATSALQSMAKSPLATTLIGGPVGGPMMRYADKKTGFSNADPNAVDAALWDSYRGGRDMLAGVPGSISKNAPDLAYALNLPQTPPETPLATGAQPQTPSPSITTGEGAGPQPQSNDIAPSPVDTGEESAKAASSLGQAILPKEGDSGQRNVQAAPIADQKEKMTEMQRFQQMWDQTRAENRADLQQLNSQIGEDRPDLFSPGSIMFALTFGTQAWLKRHDQLLNNWNQRRDRALMLGMQGHKDEARQLWQQQMATMHDQGKADQMLQQEQWRRERQAVSESGKNIRANTTEKSKSSPDMAYENLSIKYGPQLNAISNPEQPFQFQVDGPPGPDGRPTQITKTGNIFGMVDEYGRRQGLSANERKTVVAQIIAAHPRMQGSAKAK